MHLLLSPPGAAAWLPVLFGLSAIIYIPIICYRSGFRNGIREGRRMQMEKQLDQLEKMQTIQQ